MIQNNIIHLIYTSTAFLNLIYMCSEKIKENEELCKTYLGTFSCKEKEGRRFQERRTIPHERLKCVHN